MRSSHLWAVGGILALSAVVLSGCALLFPEEPSPISSEAEGLLEPGQWLIAAQGEAEPQVCREDLSRVEARNEAKVALKEEEEVQELKGVLTSLGKRLYVWRAQGCVAQAQDDGESTASQGLWALAEGEEVSLVEIPAGRDAALYLAESGEGEWQEGTFWVTLRGTAETGEEQWVHGELMPPEELGLTAQAEDELPMGWVSFLVPDEAERLELAAQLLGLLEGKAPEEVAAESEGDELILPKIVEVEGEELA